MKAIKIYLGIVTFLLVVAIGLGVYVWYVVQNLNTQVVSTPTSEITPIQDGKKGDTETVGNTDTSIESVQQPLIIKTADLPASQQKMLDTFGINGETFTITPTMLSCAEKAVGMTRLTEIQKGSAPTAMESIKLLPCLKS